MVTAAESSNSAIRKLLGKKYHSQQDKEGVNARPHVPTLHVTLCVPVGPLAIATGSSNPQSIWLARRASKVKPHTKLDLPTRQRFDCSADVRPEGIVDLQGV